MVATQYLRERSRAAEEPDADWTEIGLVRMGPDDFRLQRQLIYKHADHEKPFVFPADLATFRTDLTSVPRLLAWFVPLIGTHLPAALLHDALVDRDEEGHLTAPTHLGPAVPRLEADHLFRDLMYYTGTSVVRRNLIWAGVVWATLFDAANPRSKRGRPGKFRLALRMPFGVLRVVPLLLFWPVHRSDRDSTRGLQRGRLLGLSLLGLFLIQPTLALVPFALAGALLDWILSKTANGGRGIDIDTNLAHVKQRLEDQAAMPVSSVR